MSLIKQEKREIIVVITLVALCLLSSVLGMVLLKDGQGQMHSGNEVKKELLSQTAKANKEIEAHSPELPELQLSLSVTPMTERRPELDSHQEPERPSSEPAELWLVLSLVDRELTSHSSRPTTPGTKPRVRERTGQELEVLP